MWINSLEVDDTKKGFQNLKPGSDYERMFAEAQFTSENGVYKGRYKERFATKGELMNLL